MLSSADADLVQRDPALPGLATLLDVDAFVATLRPFFPEADFGAAQAVYVRYKPGTSCLVGYQLKVNGQQGEISVTAYRPDAHDKLQKALEKVRLPGRFGSGRIVVDDAGLVISVFPNDSKLKALHRLAEAGARKRLLRKLMIDRPDLWDGSVHSLRYKPERRYVGQVHTREGPQAALKMYTDLGYQAARRNTTAFQSCGSLRLARLLGCSDRWRILAFEWLPGRLLSEVLTDTPPRYEEVARVGMALAALHAQHPDGLQTLTREAEIAPLCALATWLHAVCPHLSTQASTLAQQLAARLRQESPVSRPVHGDFYAKQILLNSGTVSIIDFDEAVRGDPIADLGLFIAHLERDALRGTLPYHAVQPIREQFLAGYQAATGYPIPARIALYTAVGLFRLAPDPFRHRELEWPERTAAIIERAAAILAGG